MITAILLYPVRLAWDYTGSVVLVLMAALAAWVCVARRLEARQRPVPPVPSREHQRILRDAAERLADDDEIASVVHRWTGDDPMSADHKEGNHR